MSSYLLETGYIRARVEVSSADVLECGATTDLASVLPGGWRMWHSDGTIDPAMPTIVLRGDASVPRASLVRDDPLRVSVEIPDVASRDFAYIAYTLLERARQLRGMITLHAASALLHNGTAVLIVGDKGAGKTTTLVELVAAGCTPGGDDLVVISPDDAGVRVLPGCRRSARRIATTGGVGFYEAKRMMDLGGASFLTLPTQLTATVRVNIHPANTCARMERAEAPSLREVLRLHENLARYIHGIPTPLMCDGVPVGALPSLDGPGCVEVRNRALRQLVSAPFFYLAAPTSIDAAALIIERFGA